MNGLSLSSGHAEQLLFSCLGSKVTVYCRKLQWVFFDSLSSVTLTCEFRNHRAGSQLKMSESQTKAGNQECFETLTLSLNLFLHAEQLLFSWLCWKVTFSHSLILSFTLSRHAEQLLFSSLCSKLAVYGWKLQCFFWPTTSTSPYPVSLDVIELVPS